MDKCKLCLKNKADKKGSHIIPHFLLKRVENVDGDNGRDKGLGFSISGTNTKGHFERSVQPEKIESVFGKVDQKLIDNNSHPSIEDHFFCKDCEKRFSMIESIYANTIKTVSSKNYQSGVSYFEGVLFWVSVIWRMCIQNKSGVKYSTDLEETLRLKLDKLLPSNEPLLNEELMNKSHIREVISYKILRCHNMEEGSPKFVMLHPEFEKTPCLFIDEFVIILIFNDDLSEFENKDCFGLNAQIRSSPLNKLNDKEKVYPIDNEIVKSYMKLAYCKMADEYKKDLFNKLDLAYNIVSKNNNGMPNMIKNEILKNISSQDKPIGHKYSFEKNTTLIMDIIKKHQKLGNI